VRQTRDGLVEILRAEDPHAANWVDSLRQKRPEKPSVVVVGETNRGKSSLVNSLLGVDGMSPVNASVSTATYLMFSHGEQWQAKARYPGRFPSVPIPVERLVDWVSVTGNFPEGQLPPRYVEVSGPSPILQDVSIVDTPGVGGLNSLHAELAMEAAGEATTLLFVVDASSPFTHPELRFLSELSERVETVVFALSKVDQFRGWREVLEADKKLLLEHAPRFANAMFHAISPRMFQLASQATGEHQAELLRERSGIDELRELLRKLLVGRSVMLSEANILRALSSSLGAQQSRLRTEHRALSAGESEAEKLRKRRDDLAAQRRTSTRGWQLKLRGEIQRTRVEIGHEGARQMRDAQAWFRQRIDAAGREQLADLPRQVDLALRTISRRMSAALAVRLNRVTDIALADLFSLDELAVIRAHFAQGDGPPIVLRLPDKRPPTAEDKLLVFMGVSGGFGASRIAALPLAGVALLNPVILPATIVIGLGAGWWMARTRRHAADKQHLKQWLVESIADARSTLDQLVAEQLIEAEQQLSLALDEALGRRIEAIDTELSDVDKAIKMDAQDRARAVAGVRKRLETVTEGRGRAEELLTRIRTLRDQGLSNQM
jgi:hypothetical protein